jgi:hypothetical protein
MTASYSAMSKRKREQKRVPKENRKNLRLWAEGARESILIPHLDQYTAAMNQGWQPERKYLKKVCREFHVRVNWRTLDHEEPIVADWDPDAQLTQEDLPSDDQEKKHLRLRELDAVSHIVTQRDGVKLK